MEEKDLFLFKDYKKLVRGRFINSGWVIAYCDEKALNEIDQGLMYSALIAKDKVTKVLSKYDWDLHLSRGPGFSSYYDGNIEKISYYRFFEDGIEPIVYYREFNSQKNLDSTLTCTRNTKAIMKKSMFTLITMVIRTKLQSFLRIR